MFSLLTNYKHTTGIEFILYSIVAAMHTINCKTHVLQNEHSVN